MSNGTNANYERIDTNYEFFPSVRQGYRPTRVFDGDDPQGRTTMGVDLTVKGKNKDSGDMEEASNQPHTDLRMYGPGDVTGIDRRQVIRVEPEPNTDTFPPNYFPLLEFDRADLAWLFSPERANESDAGKARPWMCLVVVERDDNDVSVEAKGDKPLPALTAPQTQLPPVEEVWAWAHVQVVGLLSTPELDRVFTNATPQAVCRLLCPRNLDANTSYIAAVVPTFEPGRKIGLGQEPFPSDEDNPPLEPAWETDGDGIRRLPIYYKWEFTTGKRGDFESMVRKLEPRNLSTDYEIGVREVDMSDPGPIPLEAPDGITRKLGGALNSPTIDPAPYPEIAAGGDDAGKRKVLRDILNDPSTAVTEDDSDIPVKGPPIYGQWYVPPSAASPDAVTLLPTDVPQPAAVPTESSSYFTSWFHDLNVNPQYRIPAGYGKEVIQENQEALMEEAWNRFGDLEEANEKIGKHQAGHLVGSHIKKKFDQIDTGVVGMASRVQSIREIHRRIEAAQAVDDISVIEGVDLGDSPGVDPDVMEAAGVDLSDSDVVDPQRTRFVEGIEGSDAIEDAAVADEQVSGGGMEVTGIRPDGGGGLALDTSEAARFASVISPAFQRVARPGGKLNRALGVDDPDPSRTLARTTSDQPGAAELGTRFASAARADQLGIETPPTTAPGAGGGGGPGTPGSGSGISATGWRVTEDGRVLDLAEAVEYYDDIATVPKTLLQVESVVDHCETARDELATLRALLAAAPSDQRDADLRAAVSNRPTVTDHAEAVRRNTFDSLDRHLRKLVAADPPPLDDAFTAQEGAAVVQEAVNAHDRLMDAVKEVARAVRSDEFDADALVERTDEALTAVDDIETAATRVREHIAAGVSPGAGMSTQSMQLTSGEVQFAEGARIQIPDRTGRALFQRFALERQFDPELQVQNITMDLLEGRGEYPGILDAGAWSKHWAGWKLFPSVTERENQLDRIMAAPEFDWPMYEDLRDLDEQYLLPGVDEIPRETIGALATNPKFIESFMCGLNHEMGRELLWRRYPTDRRGTYFRQFWDYRRAAEQKDIKEMHKWLTNDLGRNDPGESEGDRVVLIIRGDLLRAYPDTRIYAAKAVKEDKNGSDSSSSEWDRVPLLEQKRQDALSNREDVDDPDKYSILPHYETSQLEEWEPKEYIFRGNIDPDITFFGFEITAEEAAGDGTTTGEGEELGWFFVLEEPVGETRFGLDVPNSGDYNSIPYGVRDGSGTVGRKMDSRAYNSDAEKGWDGLSWGHLVDSESAFEAKEHVRVEGDRPAQGSQPWAVVEGTDWTKSGVGGTNTWQTKDESEWGRNAAHMAHITWQQPVRVCLHADDILPAMSDDDGGETADTGTARARAAWSSSLVAEDGDSA